jgi:hypothetical protein
MDDDKETKTEEPQKDTKLTDFAEKTKEPKEEQDEKINVTDDKPEEKKIVVEKPDGLPDELWDKERGMLVEDKVLAELNKQTKIANDIRKRMSKGLKADVPDKADGYVIEFDKELVDFKIGEDEKGKEILQGFKEISFKNNMSQSQANGLLNDYFKMLIEKGIVEKPLSEAEQKLANQKFIAEQKSKLGDNADKLITGTVQWIDRNYKSGLFSEAEKDILTKFADKGAENILIIDKFRKMTGEPEIPTTNVKVEGLPSDEEIARGMKENRYSDTELQKIMEKRYRSGKTEPISAKYFN